MDGPYKSGLVWRKGQVFGRRKEQVRLTISLHMEKSTLNRVSRAHRQSSVPCSPCRVRESAACDTGPKAQPRNAPHTTPRPLYRNVQIKPVNSAQAQCPPHNHFPSQIPKASLFRLMLKIYM